MTILVYDWFLVFSDEMDLMWKSRWTFVKVLYFWTRYSPVADTILRIQGNFTVLSPAECKLNDSITSYLVAIGVYTSEIILLWRTFALWRNSRPVRYILGVMWALTFPLGMYAVTLFILSTEFAPQPFPNQPGCNLVKANLTIIGDFIALAVLEIVIVGLTMVKAIESIRNTSRMARGHHYVRNTLYRDGVLFFICLTVLSVASVIAPLVGPNSYAMLLPAILRIMHSTLCCRVILNLRTAAAKEDEIKYRLAQSARYVSALWSNVWGSRRESGSKEGTTDGRRTELPV
ncbi:hypothetical protein BC629DRAFT_943496 [Irpex lacteus]|nr:hypothetical protein BC629DRAFT_943496 [Irpex lacteus]